MAKEFSYLKLECEYEEKDHDDGYCSGAEEDEDLALNHTVDLITSIPKDLPYLAVKDNEIDVKALTQFNLNWQNCGGSGYCGLESTRTVKRAVIIKKTYDDVPSSYKTGQTQHKLACLIREVYSLASSASNEYKQNCLYKSRVETMKFLRDSFMDIHHPNDVRINDIINQLESDLMTNSFYDFQSFIKMDDFEFLDQRLKPALKSHSFISHSKHGKAKLVEDYTP
jgi:hypothetical protein